MIISGEIKERIGGLGIYKLNSSVSEIRTKKLERLEERVTARVLIIVPWEWMYQFKFYHQIGETDKTRWSNYIAFAKASLLPPVRHTYSAEKGEVRLAEGVDPDDFKNLKESNH